MIIIRGFVLKQEAYEDIDNIADGYVIIDKDECFIKKNGNLEPFDKSLLEGLFTKATKKKSYTDA